MFVQHGGSITLMSACVMIVQMYSDYYELQKITVRDTVGYEGQIRAQNDGELKGYKAVVKVLWWYQYHRVIRTVNTLLHDET